MKRSLNTQVSSVLRIVRGERDALVRTTHFKATVENVSNVTIERKIMSTKTTFKRVALVAVAAVGLGLLTAVPSNAAPSFANGSLGLASGTSWTQAVGGQASVVISLDSLTAGDHGTNIAVSGVGSLVSATPNITTIHGTILAGATSWSDSSSAITANQTDTLVFTSSVVGTTTISATPLDASGTPGTAVTKTIVWTAAAVTGVINHSTAYLNTTPAFADAASTITVSKTTTGTAVGVINVDPGPVDLSQLFQFEAVRFRRGLGGV